MANVIREHEEFGLVEEISDAKGWVSIQTEDGETHKVRRSTLSEVALTDEDDQEQVTSGDVFPAGIRETYARGKTEEGAAFIDSGDELAVKLRGSELQEVAAMAAKVCGQRTAQGWLDHYGDDRLAEGKAPLNAGMVRMNLGNRIRAALKKEAEAES